MKTAPSILDKEAVYDQELRPLLEQIREICRDHDMPFLFSVVVKAQADSDAIECMFATGAAGGKDGWAPAELALCMAILKGRVIPMEKVADSLFQEN